MPRTTKAQRKRLLERIATLLHEDIHTEGFQEQCEAIGLTIDAGGIGSVKNAMPYSAALQDLVMARQRPESLRRPPRLRSRVMWPFVFSAVHPGGLGVQPRNTTV